MVARQLNIAFLDNGDILTYRKSGKLKDYLKNGTNINGRLLCTLTDYLIKYSTIFDAFRLGIAIENTEEYSNGTLPIYIRALHESKVDTGIVPFSMTETMTKFAELSYPYQFYYGLFMTRKQEYNPQIFSILQTFSLSTWLAIISVFITMLYLYYVKEIFKKRYSLDKIIFHVSAVFLWQGSILRNSTMEEKIMVYAWVFGAMFLCLAYEPVFFSFLIIPPVSQIKNVSQLAKAVKKGEYHCISDPAGGIYKRLQQSQEENLKIIGTDFRNNNLSYADYAYENIYRKWNKRNIVYLQHTDLVRASATGEDFVSEERFFEIMAAIVVRIDLYCKKLLESFVHRMLASEVYSKYKNDKEFFLRLPLLLNYIENNNRKRKWILADVVPAFIFLQTGYLMSFLVLIGEIVVSRRKKIYSDTKINAKKCLMKLFCNQHVWRSKIFSINIAFLKLLFLATFPVKGQKANNFYIVTL